MRGFLCLTVDGYSIGGTSKCRNDEFGPRCNDDNAPRGTKRKLESQRVSIALAIYLCLGLDGTAWLHLFGIRREQATARELAHDPLISCDCD